MRSETILTLALCCALVACNGDGEDTQAASAPVTRDAQLVHTIDTATEAARTLAEHAGARATHQDVRVYAATLAADHRGIADALTQTAREAAIQPAESGVATELAEEARTAAEGMGNLTGLDYDLAFVEGEVRLQQALLAAIVRDLGGLQDNRLQQLATDARPTIEAHVQRGRQILTVLREAQAVAQAETMAAARSEAAASPSTEPDVPATDAGTGTEPAPEPPTPSRPAPAPVLGEPVRTPPDTNAVRVRF